jgi:hypothetical protein
MESLCTNANAHVILGDSFPSVSSPKGIKFPFAERYLPAASKFGKKSVK